MSDPPRFCPSCGAALQAGDTFCGQCGQEVSGHFAPQRRSSPGAPSNAPARGHPTLKPWAITLAAVLVAGALAVGGLSIREEFQPGSVTALAFSPDGRLLASGGHDGKVRLWATGSGREQLVLSATPLAVSAVAFSRDGRFLAMSGGFDTAISVYDLDRGLAAATLRGHREPVIALAFDPHGDTFYSVDELRAVKVWELPSGKLLGGLDTVDARLRAAAFSADSRLIAWADFDARIDVLTRISMETRRSFKAPEDGLISGVQALALSADGRHLAGGYFDRIWLWNLTTGQRSRDIRLGATSISALAFSPDNRHLAVGLGAGVIKLVDTRSGATSGTYLHRGWLEKLVATD